MIKPIALGVFPPGYSSWPDQAEDSNLINHVDKVQAQIDDVCMDYVERKSFLGNTDAGSSSSQLPHTTDAPSEDRPPERVDTGAGMAVLG